MALEQTTWPADKSYVRPIVCVYMLFVLCTLTSMMAVRLKVTGIRHLFRLSLARVLLLLVLADTWLFLYTSCIVLFGVGPSVSNAACSLAIHWCVFLYGSSKVLIYTFLVERLFIVHKRTMTSTLSDRIRNPWFVGGISLLSLWVGGAICLFLGRRSSLLPDGQCFIGIKVWTDSEPIPSLVCERNLRTLMCPSA